MSEDASKAQNENAFPEDSEHQDTSRGKKTLDEVRNGILGVLSVGIMDQLRRVDACDVTFLNQTYGDVADLVLPASIERELVETVYGTELADGPVLGSVSYAAN